MKKPVSTIDWTWYTALKHSDTRAVDYMVRYMLPLVIRKLSQYSAGKAEAEDVFMDVFEAIFRKLRKTEQPFFEEEKFQAYFLQACIWHWFKISGKKSVWLEVTNDLSDVLYSEQDIEQELFESEQAKLFWDTFDKLGADCQKVLRLFILEEKSHQEIVDEMGYQYQYAKKKKYKCYQKLVELIKRNRLYRELTDKNEHGDT